MSRGARVDRTDRVDRVRGAEARRPTATYRLQLRGGVDLDRATALVPYLRRLGVSHLYLSPLFVARSGSAHGYDVVDPSRVDPALGGQEAFERLSAALRQAGLGLLLDVVPNHMAASPENPWWQDLLCHGQQSRWAEHFDVDWSAADGKLLLPILGEPLDEAVERMEVIVDPSGGAGEPGLLTLDYSGHRLPLRLGDDPVPTSPEELAAALERQPYRPVFWRRALERLGYRRFFDISDLVALRMDRERVFAETHEWLLREWRRGRIDGLRIDHVDGLVDPADYLQRLDHALGLAGRGERWVVVEKILSPGEELPEDWHCAGTTGYEHLNAVSACLVEPAGFQRLALQYRRFTGHPVDPQAERFVAKREVLETLFRSEVSELVDRLTSIEEETSEEEVDRVLALDAETTRAALVALTAGLEVYRTYLRPGQRRHRPIDRERIAAASARARRLGVLPSDPGLVAALERLEAMLGLEAPWNRAPVTTAVLRWQLLSGPAMAKGLEDTTLYRLVVLGALNEVGGEPDGVAPLGDVAAFHRHNREARLRRPGSLLASSTHDTKRSEDARARLLSRCELAEEWEAAIASWHQLNRARLEEIGNGPARAPRAERLFYQSLLALWPLEETNEAALDAELVERLVAYLTKAAREAKLRTSWIDPDPEWEAAQESFVRSACADRELLAAMRPLARRMASLGAWLSLSQLVLKLVSPGVPDVYQGCELWQPTLVDPDNRRAVDFGERRRLLADLEERSPDPQLARELVESWCDGRMKLWLTGRGLELRRRHPALEPTADYLPVEPVGTRARHLVAVARRSVESEQGWVLALAPRYLGPLTDGEAPALGEVWEDTRLPLPEEAPRSWLDVLTGERCRGHEPRVSDLLAHFPVALLHSA